MTGSCKRSVAPNGQTKVVSKVRFNLYKQDVQENLYANKKPRILFYRSVNYKHFAVQTLQQKQTR